MVQLPLSILGLVFAELHPRTPEPVTFSGVEFEDPKRDLHSCTLVCRAWKPLATSHLFRKIAYSFVYDLEDLELTHGLTEDHLDTAEDVRWVVPELAADSQSNIPAKSLDDFRTFLLEHPAICASVRHLLLVGHPLHPESDEMCRCSPDTLIAIISVLLGLQKLELLNVAVTSWNKSVGPLPYVVERPLRYISVGHTLAGYKEEFVRHRYTQVDSWDVLKCFGEVTHARINLQPEELWMRYGSGATLPPIPNRLRPHTLILAGQEESADGFLRQLAECPDVVRAVRKLHLVEPWPSLVRSVSRFVQEASGNLQLEELEASSVLTWINGPLVIDG